MTIKKVNLPKQQGSTTIINAPSTADKGDYLPANGDPVGGYNVKHVVTFEEPLHVKKLILGGVTIEVDTDGNAHVVGNFYADGFVSAGGSNPSAGGSGGGSGTSGIDEDELWRILAGDANSRQILSAYMADALKPYFQTSAIKTLTIQRGGTAVGTYTPNTASTINIALPTFAEVKSKPTTLAGYGITDAMTSTAITTAINNAIATEVTNRNNAISTAIAPVQTTANTAQATADSANSKVDNLQIGGRNYAIYSDYQEVLSASSLWGKKIKASTAYQDITEGSNIIVSFDYVNNITSGRLRLRFQGGLGSDNYILNCGDFSSTSNVGSGRRRVKCFSRHYSSLLFMAENSSAVGTLLITNVKLELGNKATDWTPAPEDVEEKINNTKTEIINGNVASATKLQTARSLWGNSFDGTKDINGTIKLAEGSRGRNIWISGAGIQVLVPTASGFAMGMSLYNNDGTTAINGAIGFFGNADNNQGYVFSYIGDTYSTNNLRVWKGGNVTIGRDTNTGYKLDVNGTIKGTTAFLGRLMIGYTTEDTNYSIKCDGRFYAGDDSEINGLLTVDSLVASDNIKGQSLTILGVASITDLSCNIITSNTINANIGIQSNGYVSAMASSASDGRFKTDVQDFNSLSILQRFTFVAYKWRQEAQLISSELHDNTTNFGVIAQDADGIIDGLVYDAKTQAGTIKAVRYEKLIPIVAKGVQELNDEVTMLRAENAKLRAEIDEIKKQIKRLWNKQF